MREYVGMTHRTLAERLNEHLSQGLPAHTQIWQISTHQTKQAARRAEVTQAMARGLQPGPEGSGPKDAVWTVYLLTY